MIAKYLKAAAVIAIIIEIMCITALVSMIEIFGIRYSDIFYPQKRISLLEDRPLQFTHDIIVDCSVVNAYSGIEVFVNNLLYKICEKRPNWRFILLFRKDMSDRFSELIKLPNVIHVPVRAFYYDSVKLLRDILNISTFGIFKDQISQMCFNNVLFMDSKCDMIWDTCAEIAFNDFSIPKVSTIHDVAYIDVPGFRNETYRKTLMNRSGLIARSSSKIVTISEFSKRRIMQVYGIPSSKIDVVYNYLPKIYEQQPEQNESVLLKFNLTRKKYLIYTSAYWKNKNHINLLKAYIRYRRDKSNDVKLVFVGKLSTNSDISGELMKMVEQNNLTNDVVFTDYIPNNELYVLLSNALAFIHPSLYEGFGIPLLEAMNAGLPIACSNTSCFREIVGEAAIQFNPYNIKEISQAINNIVTNEKLRKKLTTLGISRAKSFSNSDQTADRYIEIFEKAMKG